MNKERIGNNDWTIQHRKDGLWITRNILGYDKDGKETRKTIYIEKINSKLEGEIFDNGKERKKRK